MASIRKHVRADGTESFYVLWRDRGTQTSRTFDEQSAAQRFKEFLDANGQSLTLATKAAKQAKGEGPTIAEAVADHIAGLTGIEARTRDDYHRDLRRWITPTLGAIKVKTLTRRRVREWINAMEKEGASPKSISNRHGLLSSSLTTAVEDGHRPDNPCRGIRLPEKERRKDKEMFLEVPEYRLLLAQFEPRWVPLLELLAGTGARWSEATALTVDDVMLDAKVPHIVIDKAWKRQPGNTYIVGPPKTENSVRDIPIDDGLADLLFPLVDGREPGDYLIQNASGTSWLQYCNFQSRPWRTAVTAAMTKTDANPRPLRYKPKIHGLRHSHASWLLAEGVDIYTISRRLGHESVTTTTGIYGHLSHKSEKAAAAALFRALRAEADEDEA